MKKSISVILAIATIAVALCAAVTVCWLDESTGSVDFNEHFHGSTEAAYFAGGTGSADSPYEIRSAVHLYNLAWLQYLGYFNMNPDFNNGLAQSHFVVKEKVDMSAFKSAIPPIGTTEYPFIGVFDGGDNTIVSVRVSNNVGSTDNALKIRPSNAEFNGTTRLFVTDKSAEASVVGLFGVTGDYDGYISKYKAANAGFTDENAAAMSVGNFYADYLHIYSGSAATLTGLVAGYAGSGISNVGVYRGDINYASGASGLTALSGSASVTSKYALVGAFNENVIEWGDTSGSDGDNPDWGGSIDMKSTFNRVNALYAQSGYYNITTFADATYNTGRKRYRDEDQGSIYYYSVNDGTSGAMEGIINLNGGKAGAATYEQTEVDDTYYISIGSKWLTIPNGSNYPSTPATSQNSAVTWVIPEAGGQGYIYAYANGVKKYLNKNGVYNTLLLTGTPSTLWYRNDSNQIYCIYNNKNNYLGLAGNYWRVNESSNLNSYNLTFASPADNKRVELTNSFTYEGTDGSSWTTYIPLTVYDSDGMDDKGVAYSQYDVHRTKNTGYLMSGSTITDGGDVRLNRKQIASSLTGSLNGTYTENSSIKIYTRTADTNGFTEITDVYGSGENGAVLGLKRYATSKTEGLDALLGNETFVYGMHFMGAGISTKKIITAPKVVINGDTREKYQMPADCIDFQVKTKGYINFFAGTYYGGEKNFFSLHQVFRTDDKITEIKEISKIYTQSGNQSYVYKYTDGSFSVKNVDESALTPVFDCNWLVNPGTLVSNAVYYMEMPVNGGEYALGSASTGDGAYLMYLDIGASATGGDEGKEHTIKSLYFVNTDTVTLDNAGNYPEFNSVTFEIAGAGAGASSWAAFERNTTENADGTTSVRYNYSYITAVTPTGKGEYDGTLAPTSG